MKIIDLLILIANKEYDKIPEKIKYQHSIYILNKHLFDYYAEVYYLGTKKTEIESFFKKLRGTCLNDEIEIVEEYEPKKIEELETTNENTLMIMKSYTGVPEHAQDWNFNVLKNKCDELTKVVNYLLEKDVEK